MAQIAFKGNASGDPELKYWDDGSATAKVSVAENHWRQNPQSKEWEQTGTTWWNVQVSGRKAEVFAQAVQKGTPLTIMGRVVSRKYQKDGEDRTWTQVNVDSYGIVPRDEQQPKQDGYGQPQQQSYGQSQPAQQPQQGDPWGGQDNTVPF